MGGGGDAERVSEIRSVIRVLSDHDDKAGCQNADGWHFRLGRNISIISKYLLSFTERSYQCYFTSLLTVLVAAK